MSVLHRGRIPVSNNHDSPVPDPFRTYRGRRIEDIVPQIRAELGNDAVILRQREGVTGGVGGFFAQQCVEVDARAGTARVDVYDDVDDDDEPGAEAQPPAALTPAPAGLDPSFAEHLAGLASPPTPETPSEPVPVAPEPPSSVEPVPVAPIEPANPNEPANPVEPVLSRWAQRRSARGRLAPERLALEAPRAAPAPAAPGRELDSAAAAAVVSELIERDLSEGWACQLVVAAAAHRGPFTSGDLRDCVRATLAASIPTPAPLPSLGAAVAIVGAGGAGKTRCAAALASAYGRGSTLPVSVVSLGGNDLGAGMAMLLQDEGIPLHAGTTWDAVAEEVAKAREEGLVVIDTVAVGPGEAAVTEALGGDLEALAPDAIFLAIPGTVSAHAGMKLISAFKPLGLAGIAITHADETDHLGIVVELAGTSGLPLAYLNGGLDLHSALSVADASLLARTLLP